MWGCSKHGGQVGVRNLLEEQEGEALVHGAEIGAPVTH